METNKFQELTVEELVTIDGGIWIDPIFIGLLVLEMILEKMVN